MDSAWGARKLAIIEIEVSIRSNNQELAARLGDIDELRGQFEDSNRGAAPLTQQIDNDMRREIDIARRLIATHERQAERADRRASAFKEELMEERAAVIALRRTLAQLTEGRRDFRRAASWSARSSAIEASAEARPMPAPPTVRWLLP